MKVFLPCLALSLAVVFCGAAYLLRPMPRRVSKPATAAQPAATARVLVAPAQPSPELPPAPIVRTAIPRPAAPEVCNDPAQGKLVFRLIDADTNQPMHNAACEFWCCFRETGRIVPPEHGAFLRKADADGLVTLSVDTTDPAADTDDDGESREFDLTVPLPDIIWLPWLIACGYEPADSPDRLKELLASLEASPSSQPVDLLMKRATALSGRVQDSTGRPVAGVTVVLWPAASYSEEKTISASLLERRGLELGVFGFEAWRFEVIARPLSRPVRVESPAYMRDGESSESINTPWTAVSDRDGRFRIPELYGDAFNLGAFTRGYEHSRTLSREEAARGITLIAEVASQGSVEVEIRWLDDELPEELGYSLRVTKAEGEDGEWGGFERWASVRAGGSKITRLEFSCLDAGRYYLNMAEDGWM